MLRLTFALLLSLAWFGTAAGQSPAAPPATTALATFAGGCFWCVEADFDKIAGVISTTSGYTGGRVANPTYVQVSAGGTGHAEAVQVVYDPAKVSYDKLLEVFWRNVDPLAKNRQFCDVGDQYRSAVFVHDEDQRHLAAASLKKVAAQLKAPIHTEIAAAGAFYRAEDYHQDYHLKNPARYRFYRWNCGRDQRLEEIWGKSNKNS